MLALSLLFLEELPQYNSWISLLFTAGLAVSSITAVIVTTRSAVASLKEHSMVVINAIDEKLDDLNGSVGRLGETVQKLTIEVALRDERVNNSDRRIMALEEEVKNNRRNIHHLRNWLLNFAVDSGKPREGLADFNE